MHDADTPLDARWYRAAHPDVDLLGLSAEEHYGLIGRLIGRKPRPAMADPAGPPAEPAGAASGRVSADKGKLGDEAEAGSGAEPEPFPIIAASPGLESLPLMTDLLPRRARLVVRAGGMDVARARDEASLAALWPTLAAFCRLHTIDPETTPVDMGIGEEADGPASRVGGRAASEPPAVSLDATVAAVTGPGWDEGACALGDLWFTSTHGLRLSLGGLDGRGVAVRLFQSDPWAEGRVVQVGGRALDHDGATLVDATLRNPLLPVLLETADADGLTLSLGLVAFPSLARGGSHHAELAALADGDGSMAALLGYTAARLAELWAPDRVGGLARVAVSLDGATGAEPIFSSEVAHWLRLFGLVVEPAVDAVLEDRTRLAEVLPALILPPDALPTIAALTGRIGASSRSDPATELAGDGSDVVPYLVAEKSSGRPLWAVSLPTGAGDLGSLQPSSASFPALLGGSGRARPPLAVVLRDAGPQGNLEALMPTSPDQAVLGDAAPAPDPRGIVCVLTVEDGGDARSFLVTLAAQAGAAQVRIVLRGGPAARGALAGDLDRLFPGRHRWLDAARSLDAGLLLDVAEGGTLLLAEERVLLHDPRTLATLRSLLAAGRTASAACVTLHEEVAGGNLAVRTESGGFFPSRVGFLGGPNLRFDHPDTLAALPRATYPVVANASSSVLIDPEALRAALPRLGGTGLDPLAFGLATLALGWRHLCTSAVRAGSTRPRRRADRTDPARLAGLTPVRWEDLLARATLVRELR